MSRSFTTRPAVAARPRPGAQGAAGGTRQDTTQPQQPPDQAQPAQRQPESRGAYTVFQPNEEKRREIEKKASSEAENYKRYKEKQKLGHVSYVGTVGGGRVEEDTVRQQSQKAHKVAARTAPTVVGKSKFQQHRTTMRDREQQEIDKKKETQRKKAQENKAREEGRQEQLATNHQRQNAAFLDRLEQQNRAAKSKKILSSSTATASTSKQFTSAATASAGYSQPPPRRSRSNVDILVEEFPFFDQDAIADILIQTEGNLDAARSLLRD